MFAIPTAPDLTVGDSVFFDPLHGGPGTQNADGQLLAAPIVASGDALLSLCDAMLCSQSWDGRLLAELAWDGLAQPQAALVFEGQNAWIGPYWSEGRAVVAYEPEGPTMLINSDSVTLGIDHGVLVVGDFDGDGTSDLLLVDGWTGVVAYLLGPIGPETPLILRTPSTTVPLSSGPPHP